MLSVFISICIFIFLCFYLSAFLSSSAFCFPFRSNTHSAAWPGPKIQNQHQGPVPRIWQVPSRSSNGHHQRDAASVQVNTTRQNHQLHSYPFSRKVIWPLWVTADTETVHCLIMTRERFIKNWDSFTWVSEWM